MQVIRDFNTHTDVIVLDFVIGFFKTIIDAGLFLYPQKHQEISSFLIFSGGIERDQWHEMG